MDVCSINALNEIFQNISGADLATLLVECLVTSEATNYIEWTPKLCKLFSKISPSTPERDTFIANAIRWTSKGRNQGHPFLHQVCAQSYTVLSLIS